MCFLLLPLQPAQALSPPVLLAPGSASGSSPQPGVTSGQAGDKGDDADGGSGQRNSNAVLAGVVAAAGAAVVGALLLVLFVVRRNRRQEQEQERKRRLEQEGDEEAPRSTALSAVRVSILRLRRTCCIVVAVREVGLQLERCPLG